MKSINIFSLFQWDVTYEIASYGLLFGRVIIQSIGKEDTSKKSISKKSACERNASKRSDSKKSR